MLFHCLAEIQLLAQESVLDKHSSTIYTVQYNTRYCSGTQVSAMGTTYPVHNVYLFNENQGCTAKQAELWRQALLQFSHFSCVFNASKINFWNNPDHSQKFSIQKFHQLSSTVIFVNLITHYNKHNVINHISNQPTEALQAVVACNSTSVLSSQELLTNGGPWHMYQI